MWLPLAEIIAFTIALWAFIRFVLPLIRRIMGSLNSASHRLSLLERRRRAGKPLTDRQIRSLNRLIAEIEAQRSDPTQQTLHRAQALLDDQVAHGDSVDRGSGQTRGSGESIT